MKTYACVYFGAALIALFVMPLVTRLARAFGIVDDPGVRKVHGASVPRLGGLPVIVGMMALTLPVLLVDNTIGQAFREIRTQVIVLLIGGAFMFGVGLIDDIRGLRARVKLALQLSAAVTVCALGVRMDSEIMIGWHKVNLGWLAWPITVFWIVGITNAINLIDGLDGLAGGISAVTCGVIAVFAMCEGRPVMTVLMLSLLGGLTGFLFFNFNPAKVFMGDCGTLFVGFMLAGSSVVCAAKSATLVGLALPALALGLPIFDTLFSIVRRILERRSIFSPDRNHIHHRLLKMGLRHGHAVLAMYLVTLVCAGLGMFMMFSRGGGAIVAFVAVPALLLAVFRVVGAVRLRESLAILRHNLLTAREAKEDKCHFDHVELQMREAASFDDWWQSVCAMASRMDFAWLTLSERNGNGPSDSMVWRRGDQDRPSHRLVKMTVPLDCDGIANWCQIEIGVRVNGSLESAARRAALFGRLIDEHGLGWLRRSPAAPPQVLETPLFGVLQTERRIESPAFGEQAVEA